MLFSVKGVIYLLKQMAYRSAQQEGVEEISLLQKWDTVVQKSDTVVQKSDTVVH